MIKKYLKQLLCSHKWRMARKPYLYNCGMTKMYVYECLECGVTKFKSGFQHKIKLHQSTHCFCECGYELCGSKDTKFKPLDKDGIYMYTCGSCNEQSTFHFNLAPVPVLYNYEENKMIGEY